MNVRKIGVICGGFSSEFEISLKSGSTIINNFPDGFEPVKIVLSKTSCIAFYEGKECSIELKDKGFQFLDKWIELDAYLIYTHGDPGENGRLQALFDMHQIPYINSGALASELSFDKWYCNQFLKGFDINIAQSQLLLKGDVAPIDEIVAKLGLPLFVKPCDSGSSYGISRVNQKEDLQKAIDFAFEEGDSVVIESFLDGTEVTCGVYRTKDGVQALPLAEIVSENEFFDYEAKYLGKSQEIVPARISEEATKKVQEVAKRVYGILRLRSIIRIDFMLVNNEPYVIEVNTTPGFTEESIVPRMLKNKEIALKDFWAGILEYELN
ncbi:MAG: D-alanine--D-alanine ligase [Crocinitomicaceae bacterium]|nr:D-alanine--D-alanine ligase [Crocinitomicaceae bacterium]